MLEMVAVAWGRDMNPAFLLDSVFFLCCLYVGGAAPIRGYVPFVAVICGGMCARCPAVVKAGVSYSRPGQRLRFFSTVFFFLAVNRALDQ